SMANGGYLPYSLYRQKNTVGNFENVGFCLPGAEGLYNILMMEELHSVFAVGAGAVTKLVSRDRNYIERIFSPKYPYEYLNEDAKTTVDDTAAEQIRTFFEKY
ncbi:MAG: coproporphyrinogen dehydrogenase HemZ, partial [Clostridia bacterium]|nr:coproporphyrinogen dehydrogenase HemZ [Clostridia bacterium]